MEETLLEVLMMQVDRKALERSPLTFGMPSPTLGAAPWRSDKGSSGPGRGRGSANPPTKGKGRGKKENDEG